MFNRSGSDSPRTRRRVLLVLCPMIEEGSHKITSGIARYIAPQGGWEIHLDSTRRSVDDTQWPHGEHWDGVISRHTTARFAESCASLGIPLVDIANDSPTSGTPNIVLDHAAVGRVGAEHLIDRGLVNFAFSGFSNQPWSKARRKGFLQTLHARHRHCLLVESIHPGLETPEWETQEISRLTRWLKEVPKPIGIMACHDARGVQLIYAALDAGLSIPDEIAILGANDNEMRCVLSQPALSSVGANEGEMGYKAAEALYHRMEGSAVLESEILIPAGSVVTRNSTEILAVDDKKVAAAIVYIREHGCTPITVADVCRHAGMARTQLEKKFREYFARSPQAELRRVRLGRIRQLLHETDLPLKKIAEQTGFEHVEYMSVFCKKALGESPGRYRRRVQTRGIPLPENVPSHRTI